MSEHANQSENRQAPIASTPLARICGPPNPEETSGAASLPSGTPACVGGKYIPEALIGEGGNGRVFRARGRVDGAHYALKIVDLWNASADVDPEKLRKRIRREAQALAQVNSPHVLHLVDFIEIDSRNIALVMELSEGPTLEQVMRREGRLQTDRVLSLVAQIADACFEVHRQEIIHRDLKPSNIILEQTQDGEDFVYLLDFGTSRASGSTHLTGNFLGTPAYASPEQYGGRSGDHRTDIYTLGAVLFHLLTGRPPFCGEDIYELMRMHIDKPAPSIHEVDSERSYPEALDKLVRRMMAKRPEKRLNSMLEVAGALRAIGQRMSREAEDDTGAETLSSSAPSTAFLPDKTGSTCEIAGPRPSTNLQPENVRRTCRGADGQVIAEVNRQGTLKVWDVSHDQPSLMWTAQPPEVDRLEISQDSYLLAVIDSEGMATLYSTVDGHILATQPAEALEGRF